MLTTLSTISLEEKQILLQLTFDSWGWVPKHFDKNHHGGILLDKKTKGTDNQQGQDLQKTFSPSICSRTKPDPDPTQNCLVSFLTDASFTHRGGQPNLQTT